MTSGQREDLTTSSVSNLTVVRTTTARVDSTSAVRLDRTTEMSTISQSLTTDISQKSSTLSLSSNNRSSPVSQTSSRSSSPPTRTISDSSKFFSEYSLSPNRTTTSAMQTDRSDQPPTTSSEATTNTQVSTVSISTSPRNITTLMTTSHITVTSLPRYNGNATPSHSFSDWQRANTTLRMTSVTSEIGINMTSANYTHTSLNVAAATTTIGVYHTDNDRTSYRYVYLIFVNDIMLTRVSYTAHVIDIGCPYVRHTLVLCRNGSTYRQTVFTAW